MPADKKPLLKSNKKQNYGSTSSPSTSTTEHPPDPNSIDPLCDTGTYSQTVDTNNGNIPIDQMKSTLSFLQKSGFGLGHVYNDLCAGVWFSYTLLFMQGALQMPGAEAGALVMVGQVGDAIATPIIGILADKFGTKRKWHIAGTGLVFLTFPLIFSICPWCTTAPVWWTPTYFAAVILLFQLGWATVQISHLAMIPELCKTARDRADLTAIRYSASVTSNVIVFIVTWLVLKSRTQNDSNIGPGDAYRFRDVSLILTLVGISMAVCFHFSLSVSGYSLLRQQALDHNQRRRRSSDTRDPVERSENSTETETPRRQKNFLKSPLLYQNAFLYVFSRLFMTTALIYIPLWLDERTGTNEARVAFNAEDKSVEHIATVPLVSFLSSFLASMAMKYSNRIGHRVSYLLGSVIGISGCVWVALAAPPTASSIRLYCIAILFGVGSSVTMISSLCITADMIGRHADQSGFIYSAVTFTDKLITGVVVVVIEALKCDTRTQCPEYYKNVLAYACGTACILGLFILTTLQCNRRRPSRQRVLAT
ncbi:major facilitator superfamily domain-containing protein 12-like [Bradysia coprophila]|uniref:major facilitator superfamily domain-containing protein 12-like n=1 Tax=Bradysia coprophila TaxID=38358 RepID=UPI00187DA303|nr:major facilitator superfamily domain-containing protein 12-like [Bradysia coprophila]XP_037039130.1 major facilitator superfamily domain-containing protein 12-like [Bradysia coprophila]XP_037039138.1 major facilitator superfamily domain-containing protein 12-like [Bradysia coprophila]